MANASRDMVKRIGIVCPLAATLLPMAASAQRGSALDDHDHRVPAWLRTELVDVNNCEVFTLADFAGTPVLLESFAPWCPVCISQQLQIEGLHDTPTSIVSVSPRRRPVRTVGTRGQALLLAWFHRLRPLALRHPASSADQDVVDRLQPSDSQRSLCAGHSDLR